MTGSFVLINWLVCVELGGNECNMRYSRRRRLFLHEAAQGLVGAKVAAEFESLILIFQVSHLFPVRAELLLARWGHVTASNLRHGVM